jgi:glycosyltransferase involved in cell wall biosynthesis
MAFKFSIITVCFNCVKTIKNTIESVLNQNYNDFEYIIIDGASTDGTVEILRQTEELFKTKNLNFKWISEKDNGIYHAMNKGINLSSGNWLNFMNAGDVFKNTNVLKQVESQLNSEYVLVYGSKIQENKIVKPHPLSTLKKGIIMACHQAMFFNKRLLKNDLKYNCAYKIYGDYDLVNRIYLKYPNQIRFINCLVVVYQGGGISASPSKQKRKDKYSILARSYGITGIIRGLYYKFFIKK